MGLSEFLQAPPNVAIFRHAPLWFAKTYLGMLGMAYFATHRAERSQIERNIMSVFRNRDEARKIVKKTFEGIFSHYAEKLLMAYRDLNELRREVGKVIEYEGLDHLNSALAHGGVVLVTGHVGAVEFMPLAFNLRNQPVAMVAEFKTERLKHTLIERGAANNVEVIDAADPDMLMRQMKVLKRGGILLTECDEVEAWRDRSSQTTQGFGGIVRFDRSLEILSRRTGATVLGAFLLRTRGGYRLRIMPVEERVSTGACLAERVFHVLEEVVMESPEQWYQWSKFHKMRPEMA